MGTEAETWLQVSYPELYTAWLSAYMSPSNTNISPTKTEGTECRICFIRPNTGLHYGVPTCEADKQFLKRTFHERQAYKHCDLQCPPRFRGWCQYCRLRSSLATGINLKMIRIGTREHAKSAATSTGGGAASRASSQRKTTPPNSRKIKNEVPVQEKVCTDSMSEKQQQQQLQQQQLQQQHQQQQQKQQQQRQQPVPRATAFLPYSAVSAQPTEQQPPLHHLQQLNQEDTCQQQHPLAPHNADQHRDVHNQRYHLLMEQHWQRQDLEAQLLQEHSSHLPSQMNGVVESTGGLPRPTPIHPGALAPGIWPSSHPSGLTPRLGPASNPGCMAPELEPSSQPGCLAPGPAYTAERHCEVSGIEPSPFPYYNHVQNLEPYAHHQAPFAHHHHEAHRLAKQSPLAYNDVVHGVVKPEPLSPQQTSGVWPFHQNNMTGTSLFGGHNEDAKLPASPPAMRPVSLYIQDHHTPCKLIIDDQPRSPTQAVPLDLSSSSSSSSSSCWSSQPPSRPSSAASCSSNHSSGRTSEIGISFNKLSVNSAVLQEALYMVGNLSPDKINNISNISEVLRE